MVLLWFLSSSHFFRMKFILIKKKKKKKSTCYSVFEKADLMNDYRDCYPLFYCSSSLLPFFSLLLSSFFPPLLPQLFFSPCPTSLPLAAPRQLKATN